MTKTTWTLRDAMRLSHPKGVDKSVGAFILRGEVTEDAPAIVQGFQAAQAAKTEKEILSVLSEHQNLPWEALPTEFHKSLKVWRTLFENGALNGQALVRNVLRFARLGAFSDMKFAAAYAARLTDEAMIQRTRLHPMNYLNALVVYTEGQVNRGGYGWGIYRKDKDWAVSAVISKALEDGFYKAFKYVEPANKATLVALDVSGSMHSFGATGLDLTAAQVGAAMAMTIMRTEPAHEVMGFSNTFRSLGFNANTSLTEILGKTRNMAFGSTDCALPMTWALQNKVEVETFVVITDSETYAGRVKPVQALDTYQQRTGIPARLAVVAASSTEFSIADPSRSDMLDVVGADSNLPKIITEFSAGRL